ncbi:4'-phosphopantetheinyl transferase family protein [Kitasatospora sp. NPDC057198]|uniref:4'-phosphopantetheinyl transferase family protein n=1 Tax=Kitasatospora sp. NPDC057198 TaxID=3346046 RepID=UPI00363453E3
MTDVWLIRTDLRPPWAPALLDREERARAARHPEGPQRHRFVTAHAVARLLTAEAAGLPPERIRWRRGPHGRPEPDGLRGELSVNLSTAGPWALFAVHHREEGDDSIGVDLEPVPADRAAARLAARYYPQDESACGAAEFTLRWTRKEAYTKAHGGRLADGLRTHAGPPGGPYDPSGPYDLPDLPDLPGPSDPSDLPDPHRMHGPLGPCTVHDLPAPPGYRAAVARTGTRPLRPRLRRYPDPTRPAAPPSAGPDPD